MWQSKRDLAIKRRKFGNQKEKVRKWEKFAGMRDGRRNAEKKKKEAEKIARYCKIRSF